MFQKQDLKKTSENKQNIKTVSFVSALIFFIDQEARIRL